MKSENQSFKENIKKYGRQLNSEITFGNTTITKENINKIVPFFNTFLFKSVMCGIEIDSNIKIEEKTTINVKTGVKFGNSDYEYINFNNYIVHSCEVQEDTESYKIIAYDKMLESMIDYDLDVTYPITVRDYLIAIFTKLGWSTTNIPAVFVNSTKLIKSNIHSDIDYTYRDVLDELATITGSFICAINGDVGLKYITQTNEVIDEDYLSQDDVTIGSKYLINSLVFSRAEESDNIYRKDDESIEQNGLYEFRISDNQILSTNDRDDFIDELFNYIKTIEFYTFDIKSTGFMILDVADGFSVSAHGNIYPTILLNNEITVEQDIEEHLYTDEPEESETEYKYADSTDKRINQTYILVDKQNQKITQLVNQNTEFETKLTQIEQNVDSLTQKVNNVTDFTREVNATGQAKLANTADILGSVLRLRIFGNMNYVYPSETTYPSETLFPVGQYITIVADKQPQGNISESAVATKIDLEEPLRYLNETVYDEFYAENMILKLIRRVGLDSSGNMYALESEVVTEIGEIAIPTFKDNTYIYILEHPYLSYYVQYLIDNAYIENFATKAELNSSIEQTSESITSTVNKTLENYSTTIEMNSEIKQKADSITSTVEKTYSTKEELNTAKSEIKQTTDSISSTVSKKVGNDEVISKINQSAESVGINADKIELSANDVLNLLAENTIDLTSKNIVISSNKFNVDKNGNVIIKDDTGSDGSFHISTDGTSYETWIRSFGAMFNGPSGYIGIDADFAYGGGYIKVASSQDDSYDYSSIRNGTISALNVNQRSLESVKKNIEKYEENALDIVNNSEIYNYNFKSENDTDKKHIGFVIPDKGGNYKTPDEVISANKEGIETYNMCSILWKAVQELSKKLEEKE